MTNARAQKNDYKDLTILEQVLHWHGQFRRHLEPIGVTPLQAGVLLYVHRHAETKARKGLWADPRPKETRVRIAKRGDVLV